MSIIISDNFNRADSSTLGFANTGQPWTTTLGNWGIFSNQARSVYPDLFGAAFAVIEAGTTNVYAEMEIVNPSAWSVYSCETELIVRYINSSYHWRYGVFKSGTTDYQLHLSPVIAGVQYGPWNLVISPPADGSTIAVSCCGDDFTMYLNGVEVGTYTNTFGPPRPYGTKCGLRVYPGTVPIGLGSDYQIVDNFLVTTVAGCPTTWNCTADACVDPGDGSGTYATLELCLAGCGVAASYNCIAGQCTDPGTGLGMFATLQECVNSGCGGAATGINTQRFDEGIGNSWYVVLPLIDSGEELRSKVLKAVREIGKVTNASIMVYGYDVDDPITVSDLEEGINSETGGLGLTNTTQVTQSQRVQINVPNAVLHTVRIEGDDTGQSTRDTVHEIAMEQAEEGVRR